MADVAVSSGEAPVKRGRGRPPKPRVPIEAITDDMILEALDATEQIVQAHETATRLIARQISNGLDGNALRLAHKLAKKGPDRARQFYAALGRYLEAAGVLGQQP